MTTIRLILGAAASMGALLAGAATAQEYSLYYHYTYYSDASKTTIVGQISEKCANGIVVMPYAPEVQFTDYYDRTAIGTCPGLGDW